MKCKHEEISRILTEEITGKLYPDRFPPVRDLSARYHVSTRTMTKALKPLIKQGLIIPDGPRGCRVAPAEHQRIRTGFVGIFAGIGKIVPMQDPLLAPLLELVKRDNYTPLLTDVPKTEIIRDPDFWRSSYLDGYIFVYSSFNLQLANLLKSEGIAFVAANRLPEDYGSHWADFDHYPAICELFGQLRSDGSRKIALLDKPSFSNSIAYSTAIWQRVQDYWQIPSSDRCDAFGIPRAGEDYTITLTNEIEKLYSTFGVDTVIARNSYAGRILKEIIDEKSLPIKVVMTGKTANWQLPYSNLAEAVWSLFKRVRDNTADFSEYCEIPYKLDYQKQ